jgi:glyoxylase-like metal-dependent hydrolase (beta-lactamase superfamily II)
MQHPDRRDFLRLLSAGAVGFSLRGVARAQRDGASISATKLTDTVIEITGAGSNVLLVTGPAGSILVDDGLPERSTELLKVIADLSGNRPIQLVFNTHWHPENTGSNQVLAKAGAKIIAHENTKLTMGMDIFSESQKLAHRARPKEALPTETFFASAPGSRKMTFGEQPIEYGYLPQAHTDGDIYVYFPRPNILMAGGVVSVGNYPILDNSSGGWIGGMAQAAKLLVKLANAGTRVIPSDGPLQTRADLEAQAEMLTTVFDRMVKLMKQGMGPKDMIAAAPTKEFDSKWGDPEVFITSAYRGLWGHARELGGVI